MIHNLIISAITCFIGVYANNDLVSFNQDTNWKYASSVYDFHVKNLAGENISLKKYQGQVLIIVNLGSLPVDNSDEESKIATDYNYNTLQKLYDSFKNEGLRILAFPSNDFAEKNYAKIEDLIKNYNPAITFDIFEYIKVKGPSAHPLYRWLKLQDNSKESFKEEIYLNFVKFVITKSGQVLHRFFPVTPIKWLESVVHKALQDSNNISSIYDFNVKKITGEDISLEQYKGKVLLVINIGTTCSPNAGANYCHYTDKNFNQLQQLYAEFKNKGLEILAFPTENFATQQVKNIQTIINKYSPKIAFDIFEFINVIGPETHPLYKWLTHTDHGRGLLTDDISEDFVKFLIGRNGKVLYRFFPLTPQKYVKATVIKVLND